MKRKVMMLVMAAVMLAASVTGCSGKGDDSKEETKQESQKEDDKDDAEEAEPEEKEEPYERGTVEGSHFESKWMNIKMDLPADYIMSTEEELADIQDASGDYVDEDVADALEDATEEGTMGYEMMASTAAGVPNISISVEKLPMANMTADQYLKSSKELAEESVTNGMTLSYPNDIAEVELGGEKYKCMAGTITYEAEDVSMVMNSDLCVRVKSGYAILITLTYTEDTAAQKDELLGTIQQF